jgi:hypothetical protein
MIFRCLLLVALGATALFPDDSSELAKSLGISFSGGPGSPLILERDGKRYSVDVAAKTVQQIGPSASEPAAAVFQQKCAACHGPMEKA